MDLLVELLLADIYAEIQLLFGREKQLIYLFVSSGDGVDYRERL